MRAVSVNEFLVLEGGFHFGKPFGVDGVIGEFPSAATSHRFEVCLDWKSVGQLVGVVDVDAFCGAFRYYAVDDDFVGVDVHVFGGSLQDFYLVLSQVAPVDVVVLEVRFDEFRVIVKGSDDGYPRWFVSPA